MPDMRGPIPGATSAIMDLLPLMPILGPRTFRVDIPTGEGHPPAKPPEGNQGKTLSCATRRRDGLQVPARSCPESPSLKGGSQANKVKSGVARPCARHPGFQPEKDGDLAHARSKGECLCFSRAVHPTYLVCRSGRLWTQRC